MTQADDRAVAAKPDHVAADRVYDFDYVRGPDYLGDPFATASAVIADAPPVFWTPRNGGHWVVAGFDAVSKAARDTETFSSVMVTPDLLEMLTAGLPPGTPTPLNALPAAVDPPEHDIYRKPINELFSPKVALGQKEDIRALAVDLIEKVKPRGRCELMEDVARILPVQMFLRLFGLPLERQDEYLQTAKNAMSGDMYDINAIFLGAKRLNDTYTDTLIERRDAPQSDIISAMWRLRINGEPMTLELMQRYCLALFLAGLDTVMNAMAHGTRHLAMHPELQEQLRRDPKLIPRMTEEMLRLYSFALPIRRIARDAEFEGVMLKANELAHFFLSAADRDATRFEHPDRFDLRRDAGPHLAFGAGPHRCVGMHLARMELHVYFEELLARLPTFRLDPARSAYYHGGIVMGPDHLDLLWDV